MFLKKISFCNELVGDETLPRHPDLIEITVLTFLIVKMCTILNEIEKSWN